jgi:hypothetical protein
MADNIQTSSDGGRGLYFIVGILVVVVGVLAFFLFGGEINGSGDRDVDVTITAPAPSESGGSGGEGSGGTTQ